MEQNHIVVDGKDDSSGVHDIQYDADEGEVAVVLSSTYEAEYRDQKLHVDARYIHPTVHMYLEEDESRGNDSMHHEEEEVHEETHEEEREGDRE
jgi:hypothetical protein